jgi:glutamate N-acetyltransferase/amino-acid N-acetyltransferase
MPDLHLLSPRGFRGTGVYAGIKTKHTPDVGLLVCSGPSPTAAAVFTTNKVVAAPVKVGREHIVRSHGRLRAVVVNAGNANACTGRQGERDARRMCRLAAQVAGCAPEEVLPSSTGIIGHLMPMEKVERGIAEAGRYLGDSLEHALLFADAILTTDTKRKAAAVDFKIGRERVTVAGVCKGSGMIGPRMASGGASERVRAGKGASASGSMNRPGRRGRSRTGAHATMLAYLTTDAAVPAALLRDVLARAGDATFNAVTVDDHTSTNDTAVLLASGASGAKVADPMSADKFDRAVLEVCQSLAYQIAADGEGATKVVVITVKGAASDADARAMARAIANSPLVKCAMHGNDPNWGRIVSAAGLAGAAFDPDKATLRLQDTVVFRNGQPVPFDAEKVSASLKATEVRAELSCRLGDGHSTCWTCDLSKEYVTINADYHT